MTPVVVYPAILALAFMVGYAIRRGTICTVLATRMLIVDRKAARYRAFVVAAAGSGAVIIPLHWAFPAVAHLSPGYGVTGNVLLAGAAFGIGARLNGACVLGTLAHLTGGNLSYAGTLVGMVGGAVIVSASGLAGGGGALRPSPFDTPTTPGIVMVAVLSVVLVQALYRRVPRWWRALRDPAGMRMGPYRAMLVVGICGGLLYAMAGGWTYMNVLSQRAARLVDPMLAPNAWPAVLCAGVLVAGGAAAALRTRTFDLRAPLPRRGAQCAIGGLIMGASAAMIPGGNGTLLIHGLPSGAPHAIAAYATMTAALCLSFVMLGPKQTV